MATKTRYFHLGLLGVEITPKNKILVKYVGNMGSTIDQVRRLFNTIFGFGAFQELEKVGVADGAPDYMYTLTLVKGKEFLDNYPPNKKFEYEV